MAEKCPLVSGRLYWDGQIPDVCYENCEEKWDGISHTQKPHIDTFSVGCEEQKDQCNHDIDCGGQALQRFSDNDSTRGYALNYQCSWTGEELFSEEYTFKCENNDDVVPETDTRTFLEPWNVNDLEAIEVDIELAKKCTEILHSDVSVIDIFDKLYSIYLQSSEISNEQTRFHLMDTLSRLQAAYGIDEETVREIVSRYH